MAPARELAFQIFNEAKRFSKALGIRVACVYGKCGLASMRDVVGSRGWRMEERGGEESERGEECEIREGRSTVWSSVDYMSYSLLYCTILYCEGRKDIQYSNSVDMNTLG